MRFVRSFKLSDWCLSVIVDNLRAYMHHEVIPQMHIDFLFRLYSRHIYEKFSHSNTMTEDCILWFLNPHNKEIILPYLTESIITRLQVIGPGITSLTLFEALDSEMMLNSVVCCIPHVIYLDLSRSLCTDSTLLCIKQLCPDLVTLKIRKCEAVTNNGLKNLCGHQSIRNLDLVGCDVNEHGLDTIIKGIPTLQCIEIFNSPTYLAHLFYILHRDDWESDVYKNLRYNITELAFQTDVGCVSVFRNDADHDPTLVIQQWTMMYPNVKKVHFEFPIDNNIFCLFTKFKKLEELKINMSSNLLTSEFFCQCLSPFLANGLKKLILCNVKVNITILLQNLENLKILCLKDVVFSSFELKEIKTQETKLDTLAIENTYIQFPSITYTAIALLISLSKNVTKLYLNHIKTLPQALFDVIVNSMEKLTFLDLSYSRLNGSVSCFFKMPSLRIMYYDLCLGFSSQDLSVKNLSESHCTLSWRVLYDSSDDNDIYSQINVFNLIQ